MPPKYHFGETHPAAQKQAHKPFVISMFTHKGGVGKTTGTYNLAALLAQKGAKVLVIDADPQCNLSKSILQAKITALHPDLEKESLDLLTRKVISAFLKGQVAINVSQYTLKHVIEPKLAQEIEAQFAEDDFSRQFVLYRRKVETDADSMNLDSDKEPETWHFYGKSSDGKLQHQEISDIKKFIEEAKLVEDDVALTFEDKKSLLMQAAVQFQHVEYQMDEVMQTLIETKLVLKNTLENSGDDENLDDSFVLSRNKDKQWILYHCVGGETINTLLELPSLVEFLRGLGDLAPEDLSSEQQAIIQKHLKQYLFVNFLQVFNTNILSEGFSKQLLTKRMQRVSLVSLKPEEVDPRLESPEPGELLLLPGNYSLLLDLGRQFSFGIEGLSGDDNQFLKRFSSNIYGLNEFVRLLAEQHQADVVLLDLSPAADDFNSTLLMTSDAFLTTVNPEPFSDDAIESLELILERWRRDFAKLYDRQTEHGSGCRLISKPPKCLGYFLQKMPMRGDHLSSGAAATIAAEVKHIFETRIIPVLKDSGMYPDCGLIGYNQDGEAESDKIPHDIPKFKQSEIDMQHKGVPVVWGGSDSAEFLSAFERVLARTIGHAIAKGAYCTPKLREIFRTFTDAQAQRATESFQKKWADAFLNTYKEMNVDTRVENLKDPHYRFDYIDMKLILATIRYNFNKKTKPEVEFAEGAGVSCSNDQGVLILDPCACDQIKAKLKEVLSSAKDWPKLNYVIIPYFDGEQWACVRVEIDLQRSILSVLFDDPRGGVFQKGDVVPGDEDNKTRFIVKSELKQQITESLIKEMTSYFRDKRHDRHWQFHASNFMCKHVDQQGYLFNDTSSGAIVLANIQDYITVNANNECYSNRSFEHTAKVYKTKNVLAGHHIPDHQAYEFEYDEAASQPLDPDSSANLYTIGEHTVKRARKSSLLRESKSTTDKRAEFSSMLHQYKNFLAALEKECGPSNLMYLRYYADYLSSMLARIPLDLRAEPIELFEAKPTNVSTLISQILWKVFGDKPKPRQSPYKPEDMFGKAEVKSACFSAALSGRNERKLSRKPRRNTTSRETVFSPPAKPHSGSGFFRAAMSGVQGQVRVNNSQIRFTRNLVAGDGDCGYTAFGITRDEAYDLLTNNLDNAVVLAVLKEAVHAEIIKQEFHDYFNARYIDEELSAAYDNFRQTQATEDLFRAVDSNDIDIVRVYLEYDVQDKEVDAGYCHPCVLRALAHIQGLRLRMWINNPSDDGTIVPYNNYHGHDYADFNADKADCRDLLFVNNNHFELLTSLEGSSHTPSKSAKRSSSALLPSDGEDSDDTEKARKKRRKTAPEKPTSARTKRKADKISDIYHSENLEHHEEQATKKRKGSPGFFDFPSSPTPPSSGHSGYTPAAEQQHLSGYGQG